MLSRRRPRPAAAVTTTEPQAQGLSVPLFTELTARRLGPVRRFFVRHPVAMDAVVMLWFGPPAVLSAVLDPGEQGQRPLDSTLTVIVLVALGTLALLWRRRRPLVVAAVMTVLTVVCVALTGATQGFELGIALVLYAVAASRPPRIAWLVLTAVDLAVAASIWFWELSSGTDDPTSPSATPSVGVGGGQDEVPFDARLLTILGVVAFSLAAIAIGISVRNRRLHVADLVDRANAIARDRDRDAQLARASERSRIAREMHDVVAHGLSVMIALADGAGAAMEKSPERSRAALDELSATGRSALADMRRMLGVLAEDGAPFAPQPGSMDLDELVERFRTAGLNVHTQGLRTPLPPDAGLQLAVYRIVQESLTNALRHAPGTAQADVTLRTLPGRLEVEVVDRGATFPVTDAGGAGQGLIGMRERAGVYGGTVEAGPWHGGWRVHAVLPWHEEET